MFEEFDARSQTKVVRDAAGTARTLSHANRYVVTGAPTPQLAAREYLHRYGELLGLRPEQLGHLFLPAEQEPGAGGVEYRLLSEKHQFDLTTVAFYQTCFGLPVWEAGLSITMKANPLRVVGAQSTLHPDLEVKRPPARAIARLKTLDAESLASSLGLAGRARHDAPLIDSQRFMIYRYDAARRTDGSARPQSEELVFQAGGPGLPLPPVDSSIRDGRHYVVLAVYFRFDVPPFRPLHWVALVEVETLSALLLRPFVDSVSGLVFQADPVTLAGGPTANANSAALNPLRSSVTLAGLAPPRERRAGLERKQRDAFRCGNSDRAATDRIGGNQFRLRCANQRFRRGQRLLSLRPFFSVGGGPRVFRCQLFPRHDISDRGRPSRPFQPNSSPRRRNQCALRRNRRRNRHPLYRLLACGHRRSRQSDRHRLRLACSHA